MTNDKQSASNTPWKSYSTAAMLGAMAVGQSAQAEIIFTDIDDVTIGPDAAAPIYIDINGDVVGDTPPAGAQQEFSINTFANSVRINPYNLAGQASEVLSSTGYYVSSFEAGDLIGPTSAAASGANFAARTAGAYFYNFVDSGKFVGLKWDIGGGDFLYGYAAIDITGANYGEVQVTLKSFAYESEANVGIVAGAVPEPGSLALLAAGAGALAFRRRSDQAA
ncbi:MAG: PEP-CTERM sorting domain-containing protein [Planctomycetota bacterium]